MLLNSKAGGVLASHKEQVRVWRTRQKPSPLPRFKIASPQNCCPTGAKLLSSNRQCANYFGVSAWSRRRFSYAPQNRSTHSAVNKHFKPFPFRSTRFHL